MVFSGKNKFPSEPVVAIVQTTIGRNIAWTESSNFPTPI